METAILVVSSVALIISVLVFILVKTRTDEIYDQKAEILSLVSGMGENFKSMTLAMNQFAESKRLSTILTIEAKKDLDIKPEDFKPKREELRERMLAVMEDKREYYGGKKKDSPSTWAYCILDHSGFDLFVDSSVSLKAKVALGRILANGNQAAAKRFITMLANNL